MTRHLGDPSSSAPTRSVTRSGATGSGTTRSGTTRSRTSRSGATGSGTSRSGTSRSGTSRSGSTWSRVAWSPPKDRVIALFCGSAVIGARIPLGTITGLVPFLTVLAIAIALRRATASLVVWGGFAGCLVLCIACSVLADRSRSGLHLDPALLQQSTFTASLVGDPETVKSTVSVDARVAGKHVQLRASGAAGRVLAALSAGQRLRVNGRLRPLVPPVSPFLLSHHIAGRITVSTVGWTEPPDRSPRLFRLANSVRALLLRSGQVLPRSQQGLFAGFLLGDDRDQRPEMIDDFRASGLSHLLVVSGQNVAFTLAVFEPLLRRLRRRPRLLATAALLLVFATVTRFEPSVLRAVWMAAVVATARCLGRPQKGLRVLSLAVLLLVIIDPLLSYSVGFALSIAATGGLALWSDPLSRRLPLPPRLRSVVAPTLAAQGGASVVMIPAFGTVPVVSLLANVLVVPVAAPLMGWGVAAGLPAGLLGRGASRIVHAPTTLVLGFVAWSARSAARVPLGSVGLVPALLFGLVTAWVCRSTARHRGRWWIAALAAVFVFPSLTALLRSPPVRSGWLIDRGARVWSEPESAPIWTRSTHTMTVLAISNEVDVSRLLAAMRSNRISAVDALIVVNGGRSQAEVVRALRSRVSVGSVVVADVAMAGNSPRIVHVTRPRSAVIGQLEVRVRAVGPGKLAVEARPVGSAADAVIGS